MIVNFPRSLDRPIDIFGVRGRWLVIYLFIAGGAVLLALFVGFLLGSAYGITVFIMGILLGFLVCLVMQGKVSHRQLAKYQGSKFIYPYVKRRETIVRIIYKDRYPNFKNRL